MILAIVKSQFLTDYQRHFSKMSSKTAIRLIALKLQSQAGLAFLEAEQLFVRQLWVGLQMLWHYQVC